MHKFCDKGSAVKNSTRVATYCLQLFVVTKTTDIVCGKGIQVHFSLSHQYNMNSTAPSLIMRTQEKERKGKK
jgi:hypothetical protein